MIDNRARWRSRIRMSLVGAPVAVVALVGLTACGTSTDATTSTAASATAEAPADDAATQDGTGDTEMAAYQSCLEENGVSMPERPAGGAGPAAAGRGGTPPQGGTPPSGAPAAGGAGGPGGSPDQAPPGVDADTWAAAQEACSDLAPTPPGAAPTASPVN
jgi:hypothetical protein